MNRASLHATQDYQTEHLQPHQLQHNMQHPQYFGPRFSGDYGSSSMYTGGASQGRISCYQDGSRQTRELLSKASKDVIRIR